MTDEKQYVPIVLDCGSFETKAGLSGGFFEPSSVVRTMVTKIKRENREEEIEVGCVPVQNIVNYSSIDIITPIQGGVVTNWKELELIWSHIFYSELKIDPTKHPILLTEPVLNPKHNRERLVQLLFDTFEVSAVSIVL